MQNEQIIVKSNMLLSDRCCYEILTEIGSLGKKKHAIFILNVVNNISAHNASKYGGVGKPIQFIPTDIPS